MAQTHIDFTYVQSTHFKADTKMSNPTLHRFVR
jgi:hypothetical protein